MEKPAITLTEIIEAGLTKYSAELYACSEHAGTRSHKGLDAAKADLAVSIKKYVAGFLSENAGYEAANKRGRIKTMDEVKRAHVQYALTLSDTMDEAARALGIDIATLYRMRKRWGMPVHDQHGGKWHDGKPGV